MPAAGCWPGGSSAGVADRINTVLWFSDLRGYTRITDTAAPEQIIPLLNDYAEAIITAIHEAGGDVLKLIGDGTLGDLRGARPGPGLPLRAGGGRARRRSGSPRSTPAGSPPACR